MTLHRTKLIALVGALLPTVSFSQALVYRCETANDCVGRLRDLASVVGAGEGVTPEESEVALRIQQFGSEAAPEILKMLDDPNPHARSVAGFVLSDMSGLGPKDLGALERASLAGNGWIAPAIATVGTPAVIDFLVDELRRDPSPESQLQTAFSRLGPKGLPYLLALYQCQPSCDPALLYAAGRILSRVPGPTSEAVKSLLRVGLDAARPVVARRAALQALGEFGEKSAVAVPALVALVHRERVEVADSARAAILQIGGPGTGPVLGAMLSEARGDPNLMRDIAQLRARGREGGEFVVKYLDAPEPDVRVAAAHTLGFIGFNTAVPRLMKALADADDWRLVYVSSESLGRLRAGEAKTALESVSRRHWYPRVRDAAEKAINAIDGTETYEAGPRGNFVFEYDAYQLLEPPGLRACADEESFPRQVVDQSKTDARADPSWARQMTYCPEQGARLDDGCGTAGSPTLLVGTGPQTPTSGLRVDDGWLLGATRGEWGGELVFRSTGSDTEILLRDNVVDIHRFPDGTVVAVTGLAHMFTNRGALFKLNRAGARWRASWWKALPGAPTSSWFINEHELLINGRGGSVILSSTGEIHMAPCRSSSAN